MYVFYNPSPVGARVGDCAVRAVSKALGTDWDTAYTMLATKGFDLADLPNSNRVIDAVLSDRGFKRGIIPSECSTCYTIRDFTEDHPYGVYVVGTGTHVAAVVDGDIYDTWDSSGEYPFYFWKKIK